MKLRELSGSLVVRTLLPPQGTRVPSLPGETKILQDLSIHATWSGVTKKKKNRKETEGECNQVSAK